MPSPVCGPLTVVDRAALAGYCAAYGTFLECEAALRADPPEAEARALRVASRKSAELALRYGAEFGLTPSSRTRVRASPLPSPGMPADEALLAKRGLGVIE
jgi:phage terminase small subunit